MLSSEELRALSQPSAWRSSFAIAVDWLLIVGNFAVAIYWPHPVVWAFCFVFSARQQLALAILMHDGAHRRLYKSAKWNDYTSQFLCAAPLLFSMYSYQKLHLKHHRAPMANDDPDLSLTGGYPVTAKSFARKLMRDALGISYYKFIRYFIHLARQPRVQGKVQGHAQDSPATSEGVFAELRSQALGGRLSLSVVIFSIVLMNTLMAFTLVLIGHGWLYLTLWILPVVTALQVLLRIRGVAEHAGYGPHSDQRLSTRTVVNPLQTFLFAPHNVAYHIEHHVYPAVPFYNLPKLHHLFVLKGILPEKNLYTSYVQVLRELIVKSS